MTVKLYNYQLGSITGNIGGAVGMSIVQCGWDYLYVGSNGQNVKGGYLWKLDPLTGVVLSRVATNHTIAIDLPTTSYMANTNDYSHMVTGFHNGKLYMYLHYTNWNQNIVYRGVWNETTLQFEKFAPFVTFSNTNINGRYSTIANYNTNEIVIMGQSLYYGRFNATTGQVTVQPTSVGGTWSPSSYNFSSGFYSGGRLIGPSGDGTNWYQYDFSNAPTSFNPQSSGLGYLQGFNFTSPWYLTVSDFHPVIYFFNTNGEIRTLLATTDTRFINPRWADVTRTYPTQPVSTLPFPKIGEGKVETAKAAHLIIKQDIDNVQELQGPSTTSVTDTLVGQSKLYRVLYNMSAVEIWSKKPDGDFDQYIKTVSWQGMDSRINDICRNNSSVPTAYAIFISGGVEYLVGWAENSAILHTWKINSDGSITYHSQYTAPASMAAYSRAGWDGGSYVYFYNQSTRVIYRWTILSNTMTTMCTLDNNKSVSSSYTGSGMLVRNGYIYIPQAANSGGNSIALGVWRLSDGVFQTCIPVWSLYSNYRSNSTNVGGIQLTALHNKAYPNATILANRVITLNIEWDDSKFVTTNSHIISGENTEEKISKLPRDLRTAGNKSINKFTQIIEVPQSDGGFSNVLVGKNKIYCQNYVTNEMHIFNKNADGSVGSYIGSKNWILTDSLMTSIIQNAPSAGAMYVDSNGVDHFVGFERNTTARIFDWVINADGSLGTRTDYASKTSFLTSGVYTDVANVGAYKRAGWDGGRYIYIIGFDMSNDALFRWDITTKGNIEYICRLYSSYGSSSYTYSGLLVEDDYVYWSEGANGSTRMLFAYNRNPTEKQPYPFTYPEAVTLTKAIVDASMLNAFKDKPSTYQDQYLNLSLTALHPTVAYGIYTSAQGGPGRLVVADIEGDQPPSAPGVAYKTYKFGPNNDITNKAQALAIGFQDWSILTGSPTFGGSGGATIGDGSPAMWGATSDAWYNGKAGLTVTTASAFRFKAPRAGLYRFKVALRNGETGRLYDVTNNKVVRNFMGNQITTIYYTLTKDQLIDFIEDGSGIIGIFEVVIPEEPLTAFTEIPAGLSVDSLSRLPVSWKQAYDFEDDQIFYDLELFNGSQWINIGSTDKLNYSPIIPSLNITNARLRVRAKGASGAASGYIYSNTFTIKPAPANAPTPNALIFDGIDDSIIAYSTPFQTVGTGDFTIELSFRTTSKEKMYLFHASLYVYMEDGKLYAPGIDPTVDRYNDGALYHVALRRTGTKLDLIINGIEVGTGVNSSNYTSLYTFALGSTTGKASFFQGILSLPRFWDDARTNQELKSYANTVVPDSEQGLLDYLIFDTSTTKLRAKKTSDLSIELYGGIQWSFKFVGVDAKLPFPGQFQRRENLIHLREKVNELRITNGLSPIQWSEPFIISGQTPIKAVHWNEIEDGILEIYDMNSIEFKSPSVEKQLRQDIKPRDTAYQINGLVYRINNILKALKNN